MHATLPSAPARSRLRILQTTDLHMALLPFDYFTGQSRPGTSLANLAPMIGRLRSADVATCLFDTGDFLQSNVWVDKIAANLPMPHPMIAAMNALDYDAVSLGNHEFDFGADKLASILDALNCPAVLANVSGPQDAPFQPTAIVKKALQCSDGHVRDLRIGVLGLVTPQTVFFGPDEQSYKMLDMIATATQHATALRKAGADIVVALVHCGLGVTPSDFANKRTAVPLPAVSGIDALLTGHVHDIFPDSARNIYPNVDHVAGMIHGKPAVMAGAHGSHLGQIDLDLHWNDEIWTITGSSVAILKTEIAQQADTTADAIRAIAGSLHSATLDEIDKQLTVTTTPLHSYFAQISPDACQSLLAGIKMQAVKTGLAGGPYRDLPVLAAVSPYRTGGRNGPDHFVDIAPGPVTLRDVMAFYPFPNFLAGVVQTGREIRLWLEQAACQFLQLEIGKADQPLIDPGFASYNFDTLFGLTYLIDLTQPAGCRIADLRYQGNPVTVTDRFVVASNAYRVSGGGGYPPVAPENRIFQSRSLCFEHFVQFLEGETTIAPWAAPVWNFAHLPATSTVFQSSGAGSRYLHDIPDRTLTQLGTGSVGFSTYRLTL